MSKRLVPSVDELPEVLTAQNIADHLQIGRNTVYTLFQMAPKAGGIPNYEIGYGKKVSKRVDKNDFIRWKESQKQRKNDQYAQ